MTVEGAEGQATLNGYSGHAGQDFLVQWATALKPQVPKVFIGHGEAASANTLSDALKQERLVTYVPELPEAVERCQSGRSGRSRKALWP